jgi:hypothetical protein
MDTHRAVHRAYLENRFGAINLNPIYPEPL